MNISLKQLKIFEALVETQGYTRAATLLNMTQPAVSMQIKQLQSHIGKPLFERQNKVMVLSEAGHILHKYSKNILQEYENMEEKIDEIRTDLVTIKISAATTANHMVSHMLATYSEQQKNINFSLDITNRAELVQQLHDYEPDLVIMGEPPLQLKQELLSTAMMENPLVVIASPWHELATRDFVSMQELSDMNFIARETGSGTKAAIDKEFKKYGYRFQNTMEMSSNEAIKHSVMAGLGLGIASLHTIKLELETNNLVIINAEHFPIIRHWYIIKRKGKSLSPAARDFQSFVIKEAANYMQRYGSISDKYLIASRDEHLKRLMQE